MSICTAVNYSALAAAISMFPFVARMMMPELFSAPTDILTLVARRERGLEPLRIAPPDPKSGASANFATMA